MKKLDEILHSEITALSKFGDQLADKENFDAALSKYWKAYELIPEPKTEWEATIWILAAIGDANFLSKCYQDAVINLGKAMHCNGAIGNPFLHLRLGQCQFEIGNFDKAADELTRAFSLEGNKIFCDEDPKYINFLKTKIRID